MKCVVCDTREDVGCYGNPEDADSFPICFSCYTNANKDDVFDEWLKVNRPRMWSVIEELRREHGKSKSKYQF